MVLLAKGKVLRTYRIALGGAPVGPKEQQGDRKTPEGKYVISGRNLHSQFHRSLRISYPNAADRARARRLGVSPGGDIFIHGLPNGMGPIGAAHTARDWTDGCIAVTDEEIEEIWKLVANGTPIEIKP
jgi:murein L,D-transpeptidase YafK